MPSPAQPTRPAAAAAAAAPIDNVIFDLGGVLIDWNPRYLYRQLFDDAAAMEHFLSRVCSPAWNARQDAGRPWTEAIAELTGQYPEHAEMIAAFRQRWPEMLGGAIAPTLALLEELRASPLRLLALTNWSHETFPVALERYGFLGWFESILVSGAERLAKPDPAIFQLMLSRYGLDPARTVFIDDAPANIASASALGLHAVHFTDTATLRRQLRELGLPLRAMDAP